MLPSRPMAHLMRLSHETDKLYLGLCGNLKRRTSFRFCAAVFPQLSPFSALLARSKFKWGRGSRETLKNFVRLSPQRAPVIAHARGLWARFFSATETHNRAAGHDRSNCHCWSGTRDHFRRMCSMGGSRVLFGSRIGKKLTPFSARRKLTNTDRATNSPCWQCHKHGSRRRAA